MIRTPRSTIGRLSCTLGLCLAVVLGPTRALSQVPSADAGAPSEPEPQAGDADDDAGVANAPLMAAGAAALGAAALEPGADAATGVQGRIVDAVSGQGIELAAVMIIDGDRTRMLTAGQDGRYLANLPPGVYTIRAYFDLYHGARLERVRVSRGRLSSVDLLLDPVDAEQDVTVEELEVVYRADTSTAAAQDELRKASSGIGEGMGAQQMSQAGASDAGSAAKRVVGVTVEGSSLVIRGLGGRYARVLLNGDPLPSTDPDRPSVDLDLFPTNVIDSLTVSKTFLPSMPADFAGGVLEINTVTFPRDFTLQVGVGAEYSSQTTFHERLTYRGGAYDALGFDDGTRALPSSIPNEAVKISRSGMFQSFEDLERIAETFPNRWQYQRTLGVPSPNVDFTIGDSISLGGQKRVGYMVALGYDYKVRRLPGVSRKVGVDSDDPGTENDVISEYPTVEFGSEEVQLSGIGTASVDLGPDHALSLLTLFNRSGSDETGYRYGIDGEISAGDPVEKWQLQYIGRTLFFNQLLGDHRNLLGSGLRLRWNGFYSLVARDEPDRRNVTYIEEGPEDARELRWRNSNAERFYAGLDGTDAGGNLSLRIPLWPEAALNVGGSVRATDRDFWIRRFRWVKQSGDHGDDVYAEPAEELFSEMGIGTVTRLDNEPTLNTDGFVASQTVFTAFGMLETPLVGPLSLTGGARAELYRQRMRAQSPFPTEPSDDDEDLTANRNDFNVLPAAAFKYDLGRGMLLRAAYGVTVGRPQARELAPFIYYDFLRDRNVVGELNLRTTVIHNADLRWEWFFGEGQVLAASLFYKYFIRPIEQQIVSVDRSSKFVNTPRADTYGAELELRANLGQLSHALRAFELGSNLTLIRSEVEIPDELSGAVRAGSRRMFGQAPYVINMSLRYSEPDARASIGLVYNVVGSRIVDVGTRAGDGILPDVEELPFHALDLIASWSPADRLKLKLKWRNLLWQQRRFRQGAVEVVRLEPGTFVSVGLEYSH